jgi:molybdenum cofactor synthesis domain-containing protein
MSALHTSTQPYSRRRKQAAGLIIGNEILNGKTLDTNTQVLAQFLYARGINLARCETIPDDVPTIRKAVSRLASAHDYVFTSGGIGPTLDDVTYQVCS